MWNVRVKMKKDNKKVVTIDDILGDKIDKSVVEENISSSTDFIKNPLPVPKRRDHVAMDYAIDVDENDDFDIKDLTGKDFYDYD